MLGLAMADVDEVLRALRWGAAGVTRRQLSRQGLSGTELRYTQDTLVHLFELQPSIYSLLCPAF
jgi:hypothetical protein